MIAEWRSVFSKILDPKGDPLLGPMERALVSELLAVRNKWAHRGHFSIADVFRAVDSVQRLLVAVRAHEARDLEDRWRELLFVLYEEHAESVPGPAPPPAPGRVATSVQVFSEKLGRGQREAFKGWLRAHREDGFYVNCDGRFMTLHRVKCSHLEPDGTGNIVQKEKGCSTSLADLESWALERGGTLKPCQECARHDARIQRLLRNQP